METNITISANSDSGWIQVFIDGNNVLNKPGTVTLIVQSGHHLLTYFVQGQTGDNYSVAITNPATLAWNASGVLSGDHSSGQHGFTI